MEHLILGREYLLTPIIVKKGHTTVKGKKYVRRYVKIPKQTLKELGVEKDTILLAYITKPHTVNLLEWDNDEYWKALPEEAKTELYYQDRGPNKSRRVIYIVTEEEEITSLELDPTKPITLRDIMTALRRASQQTP